MSVVYLCYIEIANAADLCLLSSTPGHLLVEEHDSVVYWVVPIKG